VGRADLARRDRLEVDPRLDLQRRELGADRAPPGQAVRQADVARRAGARDDLGDHGPHLAPAAVLDGDPARRPDRAPARHPRGSRGRRRRVLAHAVRDHAADAAADPQRRDAVRHHLHVHRHDRRVRDDRRRALRLDPGAAVAGVLHRHPGQRPGGRRRDLDLPRAAAGDRRVPHAARRAPRGGDVMETATSPTSATHAARRRGQQRARLARIGRWAIIAFFVIFAAFPFYWMLITIFKQNADLYTTDNNPFIFNASPTWEHLKILFFETKYLRWLGNTALVGILVVMITLLLALPAAYSLARL